MFLDNLWKAIVRKIKKKEPGTVLYIPGQHIENVLELADRWAFNAQRADFYRLWKYIQKIFPNVEISNPDWQWDLDCSKILSPRIEGHRENR